MLLALLERAAAPMYGYQIGRSLEEKASGAPLVKQGTLYPLLRTMEANGLLRSEVEPSVTSPPRRYYTITAKGRKTLEAQRKSWREFTAAVGRIIRVQHA